jgi:UDP-3-O-[3-hydroxymyristoyl] glucosamine N-acyltransferase
VNAVSSKHNFIVQEVSSMVNPKNNSIMFLTSKNLKEAVGLDECENCLVFVPIEYQAPEKYYKKHCIIESRNPRLDYALLVNELISVEKKEEYLLRDGSFISREVRIGENVTISPFCVITGRVNIGDNTVIKSGVKINGPVDIGTNCIIRENSTIGIDGFAFVGDEHNKIRFPFLGSIVIKDNVEVGALCNIEKAIADQTILSEGVKLDSLSFIGHDVHVGRGSLIVSSLLAGHVEVGADSFLGFGSVVKQRIKIGNRATVGAGAVVVKEVSDMSVVAGNPATPLKEK